MSHKQATLSLLGIAAFVFMALSVWWVEHEAPQANIHSFGDALWYAVITLTTVGYGDNYPVTPAGKLLGLTFVLGSVSLLGALISQINSYWQTKMEDKKRGYLGTHFTRHVIIIGWNAHGRQVAQEILKAGRQLAIITASRESLELIRAELPQKQVYVLLSEINQLDLIARANPDEAVSIFLNIEDDTQSLVQVLNLKRRFTRPEYIVAVRNSDLKETFRAAGVRYIVSQNEIISRLVASYVFEPEVAQMTEELMEVSTTMSEHDLMQIPVSRKSTIIGQDYREEFFTFKTKYNAILIGLSRKNGVGKYEIWRNPSQSLTIAEGDYLILMADGAAKQRISEDFQVREGRH